MGFGQAIKSGFSNYATFRGRARRSEFWWWTLFHTLVLSPFMIYFWVTYAVFVASLIDATDEAGNLVSSQVDWTPMAASGALMFFVSLTLLLPSYAVWARRLHDMGQSGLWLLLNIASLGLVPLIMAFFDSQVGANQWGADPKAGERSQLPGSYAVPPYQQAAPPFPPPPPGQ